MKVTTTVTTEVDLSIEQLAGLFTDLDDEAQADFFIKVTEIAERWPGVSYQDQQWFRVGRHLRDCKCTTVNAQSMIEHLAEGLKQDAS